MTSGVQRDVIRDQSEDIPLIGQSSKVLTEALYHLISMPAGDTFLVGLDTSMRIRCRRQDSNPFTQMGKGSRKRCASMTVGCEITISTNWYEMERASYITN